MEQTIKTYASTLSSPRRRCWLACKRLIDVLSAGLALILLSPLLLMLAILIRLESPGPAIFRQQRLGRYGRVFTLYKFRSMQAGAPIQLNADGSTRVVDNDPRVTRLGQVLRRTALDELPQLVNILKGDMSLVGPRPDPAFYVQYYHNHDYCKLAVRPGLTALAHVLGRQTIGWRNRFPIEQTYVERSSLLLDIKIMLLTVVVLFTGSGVTNSVTPCSSPDTVRARVCALTTTPRLQLSRASGRFLAVVLALMLLGTLVPPTVQAEAKIKKISPVLECVEAQSDGTYTAHFGYDNRNDVTVDFAVGSDNYFNPAPRDRGQPTSFLPGRQVDVFRVDFDGSQLVWRLYGKTGTASANSKRCPEPEPFTPSRQSDFTGNSSVDLFWRHRNTGDNGMWLMKRTRRLESAPLNTVDDTAWQVVGLNDLDGDERADVLWRHTGDGRQIAWLMDGANRREIAGLNTVPELEWQIIGLRDFNGDNRIDLFWRNSQTGGNIIWQMDGVNRSGLIGLNMVSDTDWRIVGMHDFDGNGSSDVLWRHASTGDNIIWFFEGSTRTLVHGTNRVSDQAWQIIGGGDFDSNGKADIFWRNSETGANVIWLMDSYTIAAMSSLNAVSDQHWQVVSINDFDGDNNADLLWRNRADGANSIWTIDGSTRAAVEPLNLVDDAAWEIVGTEAARNSSRIASAPVPVAQSAAPVPQASLATDTPALDIMQVEEPGALMPDEGMSSAMPDEPMTDVPTSMSQNRVFLPIVQH